MKTNKINISKNILIIIYFTFLFNTNIFSQIVETPSIDYVTVSETSGKPIIAWTVLNTAIINGYIIKRYIYSCTNYNPNWHTIVTINNGNQLIYEDLSFACLAMPHIRKEKYYLLAFNINGNDTIKSGNSNYHETIFLDAEYNYCKKANILKWNNYVGWGDRFEKYEIYCKKESENYTKIGTSNYNDTIFTHANVENNTNYKYYIKAIRNDNVTSQSNIRDKYTKTINFPAFLNTDSLIVNDKISLFFNVDNNSDTERYILYKSSSKTGTYDSIAGIKNEQANISFNDIYEHERNYYYLSAIDYCNDEIFKSETISNIELNLKKYSDLERKCKLEWTGNNNEEYIIYRCNNICKDINTSYNLYYNDNLKTVFENQFTAQTSIGKFCYYVEYENYNFKNKSNTECVIFNEVYFMPNAFNPKSSIEENRTFKPKIAFIEDYELIVYGKFGNIIFQTKSANKGWNGKILNGKLAPISTYLYFVKYTNSFGKQVVKKAMVSLVY